MSFRSRSHTKPVAPPRRRSSSLTRNSGTTATAYQPTSNARPFSIHGSSMSFPSSSLYGSNQNLRSGSDYYGNGTDYRRSSYGASNGTSLKYPSSTGSSYTSPYKDRYAQNYYSPNSSNSYTSAYKDRGYYNPYTSYDNGVTTASLSIGGSSMKRDYAPARSSNLMSGSMSGLSGSSTNLIGNGQSINDQVANIGRSQSLREHERKSRSRRCKEAVKAAVPDSAPSAMSSTLSTAQKSLSSLSLQSEGYEVNRCEVSCCSFSPKKIQN